MTGIIEWTHDAQCAARDPKVPLGPPRWDDDHLHGVLFQTDKEYDFFAAIAGVRNRFSKPSLIPRRGTPRNLSYPARRYFEDFGDECAGWLHLSEIDRCVEGWMNHLRRTSNHKPPITITQPWLKRRPPTSSTPSSSRSCAARSRTAGCGRTATSLGGLAYPVRDGIPVFLVEEARLPAGVDSLDAFRQKYKDQITG